MKNRTVKLQPGQVVEIKDTKNRLLMRMAYEQGIDAEVDVYFPSDVAFGYGNQSAARIEALMHQQ